MTNGSLTKSLSLLALLFIAGCVTGANVPDLNGNAESISKLLRQQQEMIRARKPPAEVYGGVLQAEPHLASMRAICDDSEKTKPAFLMRLGDFFFKTDEQPHGLAASCIFYTELGKKVNAQMMLNSGRYYAANGEREKAEQVLHGLLVESDKAYVSETLQARNLLEEFKAWDAFSTGWKAYLSGDYAAALNEYKASDDPRAQYKVGTMYDKGEGVAEDKKQAVKWYLKAAEKGVVLAQYQLGVHYDQGEGVEQSSIDAEKWYKKAANLEYLPAKAALSYMKLHPKN